MENLTHSVSGIQFSELVYTTLSNHLFSTWEKTNGWKAKQRSTNVNLPTPHSLFEDMVNHDLDMLRKGGPSSCLRRLVSNVDDEYHSTLLASLSDTEYQTCVRSNQRFKSFQLFLQNHEHDAEFVIIPANGNPPMNGTMIQLIKDIFINKIVNLGEDKMSDILVAETGKKVGTISSSTWIYDDSGN